MRTPLPILDLAGFAGLLLAAWWLKWTPGELAWGLWTSSFFMVLAWMLVLLVFFAHDDGFRVWSVARLLFGGLVFAGLLVGGFMFYGDLLDSGHPLIPDPGRVHVGGTTWRNVRPFEFWPTLAAGIRQFPLLIVVSLLPLIGGVRRCWPRSAEFKMNPGLLGVSFVGLHFTIMALIALEIFAVEVSPLSAFAVAAVVLTINYFPWRIFKRDQSHRQA